MNNTPNLAKFEPNSEVIYSSVKSQISSSSTLDELLPYVKALLPIDDLQLILLNRLETSVKNRQNNDSSLSPTNSIDLINSNSNLVSVYYQVSPITDILPSDVMVKIIKYIESKQYSYLPILSKEFKHIMYNNPSIYQHV